MKRIIDVREQIEFLTGHVKGAVNLPISRFQHDFEEITANFDKDDEIIIYCRSGNRAGMAEQYFRSMGFRNIKNGINKQHTELHHS
ncbi:rhodanese-like domain-containing protein [Candidatus Saccharibacteria bacterium]|nr:rhodanese-like domain-containing protein [Candidatus Saccharibacteria bacterium]